MKSSVKRPRRPEAKIQRDGEHTFQEIANTKLMESGEKERLKELLRERLLDCGWRYEMKALCREIVRKKGSDNVTIDDLIDAMTPKGRASVPSSIETELLHRICSFLSSISTD